jgi:hypothetical protein
MGRGCLRHTVGSRAITAGGDQTQAAGVGRSLCTYKWATGCPASGAITANCFSWNILNSEAKTYISLAVAAGIEVKNISSNGRARTCLSAGFVERPG